MVAEFRIHEKYMEIGRKGEIDGIDVGQSKFPRCRKAR
jgi:hypothetical protein